MLKFSNESVSVYFAIISAPGLLNRFKSQVSIADEATHTTCRCKSSSSTVHSYSHAVHLTSVFLSHSVSLSLPLFFLLFLSPPVCGFVFFFFFSRRAFVKVALHSFPSTNIMLTAPDEKHTAAKRASNLCGISPHWLLTTNEQEVISCAKPFPNP